MWTNLSRYSKIMIEGYNRSKSVGLEMTAILKNKITERGGDIDWESHRKNVLRAPLVHQTLGTVSALPFVFPVIHDLFTLTSSPILLSGQAIYAGCLISYLGGFRGGRAEWQDGVSEIKEHRDVSKDDEDLSVRLEQQTETINNQDSLKNKNFNENYDQKLKEIHNFYNKKDVKNEKNEEKNKIKEDYNNLINENIKNEKNIRISDKFYIFGNHNLNDFHQQKENNEIDKKNLEKNQFSNENMANSVEYKRDGDIPQSDTSSLTVLKQLQNGHYNLGVSVVPLMVACVGLPQATTLCSVLLMSGMGGLTYVDMHDRTYPRWMKSLRLLGAVVAISSMSLTLLFSFIMPLSL